MSNGYINGKPDVTYWLQQINAGIAFRKKYAREDSWKTWRAYYRGNFEDAILPSNLFFKILRTIVPRIYFRNPSVSVQPGKPGIEHWIFAQLQERIDNKLIRRMRLKREIKKMVQDAFFFGTGVGKLGFGALHTPTPNQLGMGTAEPTAKGKRGKQRVEYHSRVQPDMPWFLRVPTGNFIVQAGLTDMDQGRWVAEWHRRPLDDVKDDPRLKHTSDLKPTSKSSIVAGSSPYTIPDIQNPVDMIDLVEIRDKKEGRVMVLAPFASERVLLNELDAMQVTGRTNYYDLVFNMDDEVFWGVPDAQILEPEQLEANETRTMMMRHRRLALAKIIVKSGTMREDEAAKLVSEDVNPVINFDGEPMTDLRLMEGTDIPDALFKMREDNQQETRESMGMSRNEFGETSPPEARTSKFESQIVKAATEIRVDERRDMIADLLVDMIEDMHTLIHSQWSGQQVIDVAGPGGIRVWVEFNPEMLKRGAYEVKIDPDTSLPETKEFRMNRAVGSYQLLKDNPLIDPMMLTKYLLHEMHGVQFDDMIRMPAAGGNVDNPLSVGQFQQLNQVVADKAPRALSSRQVG